MLQTNVQLVTDSWTALIAECRAIVAEGPSGVCGGSGIVTDRLLEALASFEELEVTAGYIFGAAGYVVVPLEMRGRVRGSRAQVAMREAWVCRVIEGAVVEVRDYRTLEQAIDAVKSAL
jgi:hypothetical protein